MRSLFCSTLRTCYSCANAQKGVRDGNNQPMRKKVTPETAYEVWQSYDGTWTYFVLKKYQPPEKEAHNSYARWYCLVKTPINPNGEYGDVYVSDEAFEQISAMVKANRSAMNSLPFD